MQSESILFNPIKIHGLALKNRITMAPLYLGYADQNGMVTPLLLDHYQRMARSGASLIVVENTAIDRMGLGSPHMLRAYDDSYITGLTLLAKTVKQAGALAFLQINHAGRYAFLPERIAPSPVKIGDVTPRKMTIEEVDHVIKAFAKAAGRAKTAGFDGVELHGGAGYLLSQFFSPRLNRRNDAYGGTLENRMRFPLEVVDAVRQTVGDNFPVGYRFLADELLPDGLIVEEAGVLAQELEKKRIAYISVMIGVHESFPIQPHVEMEREEGYMVPFAHTIKGALFKTPVITAGRIQTPGFAESIIREGKTDLIGLARVLFADPLWPKKARGAVQEPIIPCNESCSLCARTVALGRPAYCSQWSDEERTAFQTKAGRRTE